MHAPLVLRAAARGDAVDHDLALAQAQVALVEQAAAHEALDQPLVARERTEQHERRDARRHQRIEAGGDLGVVGRLGRGDAAGAGRGCMTCGLSSATISIA